MIKNMQGVLRNHFEENFDDRSAHAEVVSTEF